MEVPVAEFPTINTLPGVLPADGCVEHLPKVELTQSRGRRRTGVQGGFRIHRRRVYGLCLRMTQNVAEAEDITQEVFILLHRKAGSFRGESQFNTLINSRSN